jgi:dolichol-phosphate mannosyltransferase
MTQVADSARLKIEAELPSSTFTGPEDLTLLPPDEAAWFTIIVPTRNEAGNIGPLVERLRDSLDGVNGEVLFIDDSEDDTPAAIRSVAREAGIPIRLLHRPRRGRRGGLGGAVVEGLRHARGTWAVVMDGDLQHPPELAAKLVAIGHSRRLDLVAGTRYQGSGTATGLAGGFRRAASGFATKVTKAAFPRRLARLSDPMSGFFAVRLSALNPENLNPIGFKILLEIAVRQPRLHIAEVPFTFGVRFAEESKASAREGLRFARHLLRLRLLVLHQQVKRSSTASRSVRIQRLVTFGLVGLSGVVINTGALWVLTQPPLNHHYLIAAVVATEFSTTWNFVLTELLVFRGAKPGSLLGRGFRFYLLNHFALLLRLPLLALFVATFGIGVLVANFITLALLFVVRFVVADSAIYAKAAPQDLLDKQPMRIVVDPTPALIRESQGGQPGLHRDGRRPSSKAPAAARRHLPYRYSIDGLITVGSQVPLPELEYFRAQWVGSDVDLSIRIGQVGESVLRSRALMTQYTSPPAIRYEEHFRRLGANFHVEIGDPIQVTCSPWLASSPHVLYTNVIEALLRFLAVSRNKILLHSACLQLNGSGLLLSARTDTGKTGSVLRLLREFGAFFLSDDMTIIDPDGSATCFPKPLTISHHTLRAVQAGDLSAAEWRRLKLQSRLHSKEGRQFGMLLASLNIPIMGINSLTQRIVPPPKYDVDRLVDCTVIRNTRVENLFVIERGTPGLSDIGFDEGIQTLVENTDDAYGFPPFRQMAPSIVIGADDYAELRRKERALLRTAMSNIRMRRLASDSFSWADDIAALLGSEVTDSAQPVRPAPVSQPLPASAWS